MPKQSFHELSPRAKALVRMSIGCMYAWHYKGLAFVAIGVILAVLNPHDVLRILAPTLFIGALVLVWDLRRPWSPPSLE